MRRGNGQRKRKTFDIDAPLGIVQEVTEHLRFPVAATRQRFEAFQNLKLVSERAFILDWPATSRLHTDVNILMDRLHWRHLCTQVSQVNLTWVQEFYASLIEQQKVVTVRGVEVEYDAAIINSILVLPPIPNCEYQRRVSDPTANSQFRDYVNILCTHDYEPMVSRRTNQKVNVINHLFMDLRSRIWQTFVATRLLPTFTRSDISLDRVILIACILEGWPIDVGQIIYTQIRGTIGRLPISYGFGSLITTLCVRSGVSRAASDELIPAGTSLDWHNLRSYMDSVGALVRRPLMAEIDQNSQDLDPQQSPLREPIVQHVEEERLPPIDTIPQVARTSPIQLQFDTKFYDGASSSTQSPDLVALIHDIERRIMKKMEGIEKTLQIHSAQIASLSKQISKYQVPSPVSPTPVLEPSGGDYGLMDVTVRSHQDEDELHPPASPLHHSPISEHRSGSSPAPLIDTLTDRRGVGIDDIVEEQLRQELFDSMDDTEPVIKNTTPTLRRSSRLQKLMKPPQLPIAEELIAQAEREIQDDLAIVLLSLK